MPTESSNPSGTCDATPLSGGELPAHPHPPEMFTPIDAASQGTQTDVTLSFDDGTDAAALADDPLADLETERYEVRGTIGEGGMGIVYLAYERRLSRLVAIKRIRDEQQRMPGALQRFVQEA